MKQGYAGVLTMEIESGKLEERDAGFLKHIRKERE